MLREEANHLFGIALTPLYCDFFSIVHGDLEYYCFFCSNTVFNFSHKILTEIELKVLEKGRDFAPAQKTLNEPEFCKDFEEFCRRM